MDTPFKQELIKKLQDKNLSQNSIKLYIRNIEKLNNNQPLKNLNFLKDKESILDKIKDKKDNTKRAYLISISVCLSVIKGENKILNKLFDEYHKMMLDMAGSIRKNNTHEVSDEKKDSFITWKEVEDKYNELLNKVQSFKSKDMTDIKYNTILQLMILSLYVHHPPRRNADYALMKVVSNCKIPVEELDPSFNYLCLDKKKFVFNKFKTARKEGQIVIDINPHLFKVIELYLNHHPNYPKTKKDRKGPLCFDFLVDFNGKPLHKVNDITLILNRIFGKKIGSSMLRSIYLTSKYGDVKQEQKQDAEMMSHTVETQNDTYIKNPVKKNKKEQK